MRARPETLLITALATFAVVGVTALLLDGTRLGAHDPILVDPGPETFPMLAEPFDGVDAADTWFATMRPYCNPVEVETRLRWSSPPDSERGMMYEAACYALAGKIDLARQAIERLPDERRYEAAGVVFAAGHGAADAGDNLAAGPLMELVAEFWPNHYMALYHAGAAAWERGDRAAAQDYLTRFLDQYTTEDGWHANAVSMLDAIGG